MAVILMGKNTMIRKAIRGHLDQNPGLERLLPHIKNNVGFVFTKIDLVEVREKLKENKVKAPARAGANAPCDVQILAQNTGLGPEKTSFFQALSIPTKISRGTIEILNDVRLIKEGDKVGASEATLLNMLNISPFSYGLVIEQVFDSGTVFAPAVLDITDEDIRKKFMDGVANVASLSLETEISFPEAQTVKDMLSDPEKLAAMLAASAAVAAAPAEEAAAPAAAEVKKEESEEESDDDMGLGLFD